jgi:hypothetical protein
MYTEVQILNGTFTNVGFRLCDLNHQCSDFTLRSDEDGAFGDCTSGCQFMVATAGHQPASYQLNGKKRYRIVVDAGRYSLVTLSPGE